MTKAHIGPPRAQDMAKHLLRAFPEELGDSSTEIDPRSVLLEVEAISPLIGRWGEQPNSTINSSELQHLYRIAHEATKLSTRKWGEQPNSTINKFELRSPYQIAKEPEIREGRGGSTKDWSDKEIRSKIENIIYRFAAEPFEPGVISSLETELTPKIVLFRDQAISEIGRQIKSRNVSQEVRAEVVRVLGRVYYGDLKQKILVMLIDALNSGEPVIRESAALALGDTEDPAAIRYLRDRIKVEKYTSLRADFQQVIDDIRGE